jgi:hypothetical protein
MEAVPEQDVEEFYSYQPLNLNKASIRLVRILPDLSPKGLVQCWICHNTLEALYTCLSYRWGAPDPNGLILINDKQFCVRRNLLDFLHMARESAEAAKLFWIDAICIDQSQVLERNHQVSQMGEIYSHATRVYVWLGTNPDLQHAFRILKDPGSATQREWDIISAKRKLLEEYICDNPYWERAWIVQEIFLARAVVVWLDRQCVLFEYLHWSIDYFYLKWRNSPIARFELSAKDMLDPRSSISEFKEAKSLYHGASLSTLLVNFGQMKCEVRRDRVFSLLSMSADARGYAVDYNSSGLDTCFGVLQQCGNLPCLCAPQLVANSIGLSKGLKSFEARCCVLEFDVPEDVITWLTESQPQQSRAAVLRSIVSHYYKSLNCQTLKHVIRYIGKWQDPRDNFTPFTCKGERGVPETTDHDLDDERKRNDSYVFDELFITLPCPLSSMDDLPYIPFETIGHAYADLPNHDHYPAFDYSTLRYPDSRIMPPIQRFLAESTPYNVYESSWRGPNYVEPRYKASDGDKPKGLATMPPFKKSVAKSIYEEWIPKIESMYFNENEKCWFDSDFNIRISGSNMLVVEILLSSLHKLTHLPTACANLQLGGNITGRAEKDIRIRVQHSMWKNTINVAEQGALPILSSTSE